MIPSHEYRSVRSKNFSVAFEQMCSMVAIAQTRNTHETLRELLLQCLVILKDDVFENAGSFAYSIDALFGLEIPEHELQFALNSLVEDGRIELMPGQRYGLRQDVFVSLKKRIDQALALEETVRSEWIREATLHFPGLEPLQLWKALRAYLAQAFRRHGVQTAALLDPAAENDTDHAESLSALLEKSLSEIPFANRPLARTAISGFLAAAGTNPDRATYIAQLADGAFNYFSLTIAPDVAEQFRQRLSNLILFLDTNFLFGILDLTINPQVAVSESLLQAIAEHSLPFELRFHEATENELRMSLEHYREMLSTRKWPVSISRAAVTSRNLSGVELKYHMRYLETGVDVTTFFMPYAHVDIMLEERNIHVFRPSEDRLAERSALLNEYKAFLEANGLEKPYRIIDHDTTVLDTVRQIRSSRSSSLDAGAMLMTCDYRLYRFDCENARRTGAPPSTVLPNLFWQILRPMLPINQDFDRTFAATFAIPEFRSVGSGASQAASKMLQILAGYRDFSEETAARMLSNYMLVERLRTINDDVQFQSYVESAIAAENTALVEENAAIAQQLDLAKEAAAEQKTSMAARESELLKQFHESQALAAERSQQIISQQSSLEASRVAAREEANRLSQVNTVAMQRAADAEQRASKANERADQMLRIVIATLVSAVIISAQELLIHLLPWTWLLQHPNAYALQALGAATLATIVYGAGLPKWRARLWGAAAVALIVALLTLLGGPKPQP